MSAAFTSAADVGVSKDSVGSVCMRALKTGPLQGLQQTCVDGLTDARQFVDKKLAETRLSGLKMGISPRRGDCPDKRELWHGPLPAPNFMFVGAEMWEYNPQSCQNFEFWP